jgi:hypothetical protein
MAEMTDDPAKLPEKTAPSSTQDTQAPPHKVRPWPMIARAVSAIALSVVIYGLTFIVYRMPPAVRTFVALGAAAGALVVGGFITLIVLIPTAGSNPDVKTEFYSARAAYVCVVAGLVLLGIVTIGAVFARVVLTVEGH